MEYDVIVVGAGPAGSTVGAQLAKRGYRVLILEKETFPRTKLCAGGLPRKVLRLLDMDADLVIEDRVKAIEFTFRSQERFLLESTHPLIYTVQRDRFDQFLLQRARGDGCQIREGEPVQKLVSGDHRVSVRTANGEYISRVLVGADGVRGVVGRWGPFRRRRRTISTLQCDIPLAGSARERFRGRIWIGFGWLPNGYAWIFPKRDHISVGMGAALRDRRAQMMKGAFRRLLRKVAPEQHNISISSCPIAIYSRRRPLVRGPIILVGEAGSLVHPMTAEGIYYAIKSARMAADAIDDFLSHRTNDLMPYQHRVDQEIGSFFYKSRLFSGLFYGWPRLSFRLFVNDNRYLRRYFGIEVPHNRTFYGTSR